MGETSRTCKKCGLEKPLEEFRLLYPKTLASGKTVRYISYTCNTCINEYNRSKRTPEMIYRYNKDKKTKRREQKKLAVQYLGGTCASCGGTFHHAAFDFHHINPDEKELDPGLLMQCKLEKLFEELDKCILLCANCHRILHYEEGTLGEIKSRKRKS